ncbi:FAD/NAD(P)-binding protein [Patescibacteria group bacterium]
MINPYKTTTVKIKDIKQETDNIKLFTLVFDDKKEQNKFKPLPGQIVEIGVPGFGEAPFAPCSCSSENKYFQICVRRAGSLTNKMSMLKKGDRMTFRGPYGLGVFPKTERNLLLIAGGIGLIPLRPLINRERIPPVSTGTSQGGLTPFIKGGTKKIQLFYGVKSQKDMIFKDEYPEWKKYIDMRITLDQKEQGWKGHIGMITTLCKDTKICGNPVVILCGPPIMYKFVLKELKKLQIKEEDIYISLERRMHCGIGVCQHCAIGSKYVCKDGPVFKWSDVKHINGVI